MEHAELLEKITGSCIYGFSGFGALFPLSPFSGTSPELLPSLNDATL
jgi:hypothetical protein